MAHPPHEHAHHAHEHAEGEHHHEHAHGHHHGLGHHHHHGARTRRALVWALVLNGGFLIFEAITGAITGSLALLSDAGHMVGDVAALALALGASHLARSGASAGRTFGYVRAEVLGAFVNALALLVICAMIFAEAFERMLGEAPDVPAMPILVVGAVGLLINLGSAWNLARGDRDNLNVRGALAHMLADALGSVGAMIAAGFIMLGWPIADPIISVVIGLLILTGTLRLLRDSARVLLQFAPPDVDVAAIELALHEVDGIEGVHHVHAWTLDGAHAVITAHLVASPEIDEPTARRRALEALTERFDLEHVTLQIERLDEQPCPQDRCGLLER